MKTAIKILFIAGFGPIVDKPADGRKLYSEILSIRFKEESGEYLHTEALKVQKRLRFGRCLRRRSHVLATILGLTIFRSRTRGLSLMWTA